MEIKSININYPLDEYFKINPVPAWLTYRRISDWQYELYLEKRWKTCDGVFVLTYSDIDSVLTPYLITTLQES